MASVDRSHSKPVRTYSRGAEDPWETLASARQMRWQVPELALVLSDRITGQSRSIGDRALRLRAEAIAVFAANRLGQGACAIGRAIAAVRDAEAAGDAEAAADLRAELAWCAHSAGSHEVGLRVLQPVLRSERVEPALRAHALLAHAALSAHRHDQDRIEALDEAERLYANSSELNRDTSRLLRARVCTVRAREYRRQSEFRMALRAVDAGMVLLGQLSDPDADSGEVGARLALERVQSLLELGRRPEAVESAEDVLSQPVRAGAAMPSGWLRVALATRVHLPEGNLGTAVWMLNDAVAIGERHNLDGLLSETLSTLSHAHELAAEFRDALTALREAYAADRRWRAVLHRARIRLLEEFPVIAGEASGGRQSGKATPESREEAPEHSRRAPEQRRAPSRPEFPAAQAQPRPRQEPPAETRTARQAPSPQPEDALASYAMGGGDIREAARRLMEVLTSRTAEHRETDASADEVSRPKRQSRRRRSSVRDDPDFRSVPSDSRGKAADAEDYPPIEHTDRERSDQRPAASQSEDRWGYADEPTSADSPGAWASMWDSADDREEEMSPRGEERDRAEGAFVAPEPSLYQPDIATYMPMVAEPPEYEATHDPLARERLDTLAAGAEPPPERGRPTEDTADQGGRRSRGKSLAEIRASLRLVQDEKLAPHRGSVPGRRSRHAEPAEEAAHATPAAEFLARYGREPQEAAGLAEPEKSAELPADAGMADLLTEALAAYQSGRRQRREEAESAAAATPDSRHGRSPVPGLSTPDVPLSTSDNDSHVRRRHAAFDSTAGNPASFRPRSQ